MESRLSVDSHSHRDVSISGFVAPGFEPVRAAFETNFLQRAERGAECAVFHRGEKVVDLWGGRRCHQSGEHWTDDTLTLTFSVTKGMAAAALVVAHGRGLFELDAPVADYWPEFARRRKQDITIRQLLSHQAGLVTVNQKLNPTIIGDHERMAELLADQKSLWTPGSKHGYHTLTLGWYQNELIRRVDPQGRSLGAFFDEEIARPLGIEFYIGLPDTVGSERISRTKGFHKVALLANLDQLPWRMVIAGIWPRSMVAQSIRFLRCSDPATLCQPEYREVEIPSAGGFGQARAVAKVYDALFRREAALRLPARTVEALSETATLPAQGAWDAVLKLNTQYGFGFSRPSQGFRFGVDGQSFGCPGAGGSFGMADPSQQLSYAYLTNSMSCRIFDDPRERSVREAIYNCVGGRQQSSIARAA